MNELRNSKSDDQLEETKNEMIADALEKDFKKLRDLLPTYKDQNDEGKKAIEALFDEIVTKTRELPFTEAASKNASSLDMEESAMALLDSFAISNITAMASRVLKSSSIASQNLLRDSSISFPAAFPEGVLETYERSSR